MPAKLKLEDFELIPNRAIYAVGMFSKIVTLHNQQIRSLNLAELLSEKINDSSKRKSVAIIGAGAAGITAATKLLFDGWKRVYLFERYSHVLPLQSGCDTRWLHPNNINWPEPDSNIETTKFDLPSLNWEADTAGNVAYKLSGKWKKFIGERIKSSQARPENILSQIYNVNYLKIGEDRYGYFITWTSQLNHNEQRVAGNDIRSSGKERFDHIILANGFGLEQHVNSYWRNESFGQPSLTGLQKVYVVSGLGDGAIIDLLRLCFLDFRPDRFISEAIEDMAITPSVKDEKSQKKTVDDFKLGIKKALSSKNKFEELLKVKKSREFSEFFTSVKSYLLARARVDTKVILHFKADMSEFSNAFDNSPATHLNKFILFIAFDCGAISLIHDLDESKYQNCEIIKRHGVNRVNPVKDVLSGDLFQNLAEERGAYFIDGGILEDQLEKTLRQKLAQEI
ncbi:MAG TPA: hypothetical protein VJ577_17985 [Burkholderiaceae bacterium]|nr:hypothetical protein [Burkholderiaceae bacterium]